MGDLENFKPKHTTKTEKAYTKMWLNNYLIKRKIMGWLGMVAMPIISTPLDAEAGGS